MEEPCDLDPVDLNFLTCKIGTGIESTFWIIKQIKIICLQLIE